MAESPGSQIPSARTYKILISVGVVLVLVFMTVGLVLAHMANAPSAGDEAGLIVLPFFALAGLSLLGFVLGPIWLWIADRRRFRASARG